MIEALVGSSTISASGHEAARVVNQLLVAAKSEVMVAVPSLPGLGKALARDREDHIAPKNRGLTVKFLCTTEILDEPDVVAELSTRTEAGVDIRIRSQLDILLIVVDRTWVAIGGNIDRFAQIKILRQTEMADLAAHFFGSLWSTASSFDEKSTCSSSENSRRNVVLESLFRGYSDESGARMTGVPLRTYQREVAGLLRELGARNRFEAGYLLGVEREKHFHITDPIR